jgi:protein tyrosine phosphatase (PTP) superfamily phosphohydrolase (DUF442 family)
MHLRPSEDDPVSTRNKLAIGSALWVGPCLLGILLVTLAANGQAPTPGRQAEKDRAKQVPERLEIRGIENAFRLSPTLYSGGEPQGAESFSALKELGVKTIISVDGSRPDVEGARRFGIRYVHVPVGYDGVPRAEAVQIIKAARTLPGPVFLHCHHGKHRGPTAAALCGIATEGWSQGQALDWLKQAGTAPDYRGLFATVSRFVLPSGEELAKVGSEFPERAETPALVEMMVQVDKCWDHMKAIREAGFTPPSNHPDIDPPHEALLLAEHFREVSRLPEAKARGEDFLRSVDASERLATALESSLRRLQNRPGAESRSHADATFAAVGKACTSCHARYRDNSPFILPGTLGRGMAHPGRSDRRQADRRGEDAVQRSLARRNTQPTRSARWAHPIALTGM